MPGKTGGLVYLGVAAPVFFAAALIAHFLAVPPAPTFHLAFAVGALPLVFGAILHFTPVLTKTSPVAGVLAALPLFVQGCALLLVGALSGWLPAFFLFLAAAGILFAAVALLVWMSRRRRLSLGPAHPALSWYELAMIALFLSVSLVPLWLIWPEWRGPLRLFHLHVNLIGLFGLAAFGTLPVLMPTALAKADAHAGWWLTRFARLFFAGIVLIAAGAAFSPMFALFGAALLVFAIGVLLRRWFVLYRGRLLSPAAAPLAGAVAGFVLLLIQGAAHGYGLASPRHTLLAWLTSFLLPLVTGALAQLLPVWCHPGARTPAREAMTRKLSAGAVWRAGLFFLAGLAIAFGHLAGLALSGLALAGFLWALGRAFYNRPS